MLKSLFAERLLLRMAGRNQLAPSHTDTDTDTDQAVQSENGRKLVVQTVRDELATTVKHRALGRPVAYDELLYLEALGLTPRCLENYTYKPFQTWW